MATLRDTAARTRRGRSTNEEHMDLAERVRKMRMLASELHADATELEQTADQLERLTPISQALIEGSPASIGSPCQCEWAADDWHDVLLGIEDSNFEDLTEWLMDLATAGDREPGACIHPHAIREFAAWHNWEHPDRMMIFAGAIEDITRYGRAADQPKRTAVAS